MINLLKNILGIGLMISGLYIISLLIQLINFILKTILL
mgnify:CR=1 FL=1|jgi:hypothetical protein